MKSYRVFMLAILLWIIRSLCHAQDAGVSTESPKSQTETVSETVSTSGGGGGGGGVSDDITLPDRLPIENIAALRSYAIEEIRRGYINIYSPTLVWPGTKTWGEFRYNPSEDGVNISEVRSLFWSQKLVFAVANPKSQVQVYAQLNNNDGDVLFQGWSFFHLEKRNDKWQVPENGTLFELRLAERIPIKVPESVTYGRLQEWNESGEVTADVNVEVRNGRLYFPTYFAGRSGRLYLNVREADQKERAILFDLRTGLPANVSDLAANFLPILRNVVDIDDPSVIRWSVPEEKASTLFVIKFRTKQPVSIFPLQGTDSSGAVVAKATALWVRRVGGPGHSDMEEWKRAVFEGGNPVEGELGPGRYHMFFEWPGSFGRDQIEVGRPVPSQGEKG